MEDTEGANLYRKQSTKSRKTQPMVKHIIVKPSKRWVTLINVLLQNSSDNS